MTTAITLPDLDTTKAGLQAIKAFQDACHQHMVLGHDYGVIPGTGTKPTLLKPGAEKILRLFNPPLVDMYEIAPHEDWDKPLFHYRTTCRLYVVGTHPLVQVGEGVGECNSMESKYRWREQSRSCPNCGAEAIIKSKAEYGGGWRCFRKKGGCGGKWDDGADLIEGQKVGRVENDDIYSQVNTLLKMAKKRALVDAALSVGRLSEIFTQDLDELPRQDATVIEGSVMEPSREAPVRAAQPRNDSGARGTTEEVPEGPPKDAGQMMTWASESFGDDTASVCQILEVKNIGEILKQGLDLGICWRRIVEHHSGAPETTTDDQMEDLPLDPESDPGRSEPPETDEEFYLRAQALGFDEAAVLSILTHTKGDPIPDMALWEKVLVAYQTVQHGY